MPTRLIRQGINDSERINKLDWPAEVFYRRLLSVVDDYGLYDARTSKLRADLYPICLERVREADVQRWIAECVKAGLVRLYEAAGKPYLQVLDTRWQARSKPKYPLPEQLQTTENTCLQLCTNAQAHSDAHSKAQAQGPPEAEDGDPVTAQVAKYLTDHPMLRGWNPKDASAVKEAVDRFGWEWTKGMVQKGVDRHIDGIDYLRGCVRNEKERKTADLVAQEAVATAKPVSRRHCT